MVLQFLFAPGAGAPSTSPWMQKFRNLLAPLGTVHCLDYPYQLAGRRSPDRQPTLVAAHQAAFEALDPRVPVVLIGKSMGSRIGCHVANLTLERGPVALVCLGYPLVGQNGSLRDEVLLALRTPILFVQGSRDPLCPLDRLAEVRPRMRTPNELYVVDGGNHSLEIPKSRLKTDPDAQATVDATIIATITAFLRRVASTPKRG